MTNKHPGDTIAPQRSPEHFIVVSYDFSSYAGQTVQLRWRYWGSDTSPSFFWFAQIDEVELWDSTLSVPDASATFRTDAGATNVDMLTVSGDPVLGSLFAIEVDVAASGLGFTQIFGYSGALSLNLGGTSRVVLIDLTHPGGEVLAASIASGPSAVYPYFLPTSCSLAGFNLSVQAAGFNIPNNAPWVLSNAQDLVLGF